MIRFTTISLAALVLLPLSSRAQVSTLADPFNNLFQFAGSTQIGSVFTTGVTPYRLDSVTVKVNNDNATPSTSLAGTLYPAGANGSPSGAAIANFTMTSGAVGAFSQADSVLTPTTPVILGVNQSYLFVLSSVFGNWSWIETDMANPVTTSGSDPWTMAVGIEISSDGGGSWVRKDNTTVPTYNYRNQLSTQISAVPEPGAAVTAVAFGLGLFAGFRRFRTHRKA